MASQNCLPTLNRVNGLIADAIEANVHPIQTYRISLEGQSIPIAGNQTFSVAYDSFGEEATSTVNFDVISNVAGIIMVLGNHGFNTTTETVSVTLYNLNILATANFAAEDYIQVNIVEIPGVEMEV